MLDARDLTKSFGDIHALQGADLQVEAGQIVALLGRNGAGKTTMISIIAGLLAPDSGQVHIDGIDALANPQAASKQLGIAPQETGIYSVLTVRDNLKFFGELAGMNARDRAASAVAVAAQLGLEPLLDRKAGKLSGGEARRLHTACALVHKPSLLMLDEPTVGADVNTRLQIIDSVKSLAADGAAVIYTTHYLPEVEALNADLVIIDDGQVLAKGAQADLIAHHQLRGVQFEITGDLPPQVQAEAEHLGGRRWRILGDIDMPQLLTRFGPNADDLVSVESLKPGALLVGFATPWVAIHIAFQLTLFLAGSLAMGLRFNGGSPFALVLVCFGFACCNVAIILLAAVSLRTINQVGGVSNIGAMAFGGLGGALVPVEQMPGWAQTIAPISPQYWAMRGFRSVFLEQSGVGDVIVDVAVLLGATAVLGLLAARRFSADETKEFFA